MKIRAGLERRRENRKRGQNKYESKNVALDFPEYADTWWEDGELHRVLRQRILDAHPGWRIQGYTLVQEEL